MFLSWLLRDDELHNTVTQGKPMWTTSEPRIAKLVKGLKAVSELMGESEGVTGLHLNGDVATWDWLLSNEWLAEFNEAMGEVMDMTCEQMEKDKDQHEIRMTDDRHYADRYRRQQREEQIFLNGIDE